MTYTKVKLNWKYGRKNYNFIIIKSYGGNKEIQQKFKFGWIRFSLNRTKLIWKEHNKSME